MSYNIRPTDKFKKEAKRLVKKYPSLKEELLSLNTELSLNPASGTPLGNNTYKIRVAIKSKGKGKSGGGRVINYLITEEQTVYLLAIYDKSEIDSLDDRAISRIIDGINNSN
jgi:mRNA-degrading endonuclease RelE of RelBE toxin-antitoxin system